MDNSVAYSFSSTSSKLCNNLYVKDYDKSAINTLIDELNAKPFKAHLFVEKHDAISLITGLSLNIKPTDEVLAVKTSHLLTSVITKQNLAFPNDSVERVLSWHMECLRKCSNVVLPDILHNLQCLLQYNTQVGLKVTEDLIGNQGIIVNLLEQDNIEPQITLISLKCLCTLSLMTEDKSPEQTVTSSIDKEKISQIVVSLLLKGQNKGQDEFLYLKIVIAALRALSQLYLNASSERIPLPEVMGICRHYLLLGLIAQGSKPERIMPSQQTIAPMPVVQQAKGGKKQKLRKQRNNAIDNLKKEIPVSDRSLMRDVGNFDNISAYKPASQSYLEPQRNKTNLWPLTSDSDMSDIESGKEAKLVVLKSRVRQSASNLLLVLVKVTERRDMFGYWWALLPNSSDPQNWSSDPSDKKTLAYGAVFDPIPSSRASVLSAVLALLSGSRMFLSQAEFSKKESSFTPFSVSLGYTITCLHTVLVGILDNERVTSVVLMALKCCASLVQATPYHRMQDGLISEVVRATKRYLVHRDITLQVGALITIGCAISVDAKVDEILKSIQKDSVKVQLRTRNDQPDDQCDDFDEFNSDDEEMFISEQKKDDEIVDDNDHNFRSWILDICFRNLGWLFRKGVVQKCKPSAIPVIHESLQVLSAMCFHQFEELLLPHVRLLADVLCDLLQYEHQDVVFQAARTVSVFGDALQKLEQNNMPAPLSQCVYAWEKLLAPLSAIFQNADHVPAKPIACDCIANVGERCFKELPNRVRVLCCTLLVGSCSDEDPAVRAAAVRALAMTVIYRSLREDICFVSDCGENILRALAEPLIMVRSKAAWALGNLSDALVLNAEDPEIDDIDDDLLLRLLEVSVHCASDHDKIKMSATRGLGNLLRLIKSDNISRHTQLRPLCETAIEKLIDCASKVTNMKVRWNACYAIGNAMKNQHLFTCLSGWQARVFSCLCKLAQECKNIKVRINAVVALRSPTLREQYGERFALVCSGLMNAMECAANIDDYSEYKHKDNLIEQLCVTLAHMCCQLKPTDLPEIYEPLVFHNDTAKALYTQLLRKLPPENASCTRVLQAAKYVTLELIAVSESQKQSLGILQDIFIWDI